MKIIVDADASPVQNEVIQVAEQFHLEVILVKNYAHHTYAPYPHFVQTVYVDHGADMADFKIVAIVESKDIVITQDYGLASLCLEKDAYVIHHKGYIYSKDTIDQLLTQRHINAQMRKAGKRTKGPKKYTAEERNKFVAILEKTIREITE